ncbi:Protein DEL-7 [Aphelenchoides avenae]|nr:Protein DEL-7 [Aphelenchus avenae]
MHGISENQIVLFVSDKYPDIRLFPRFYLNRERYMVMHLRAVVYKLLPTNKYCSASPEDRGQGTCPINSWLRTRVIGPHNCTLFYMHHKNPDLEICRPEAVISDYYNVTGTPRERGVVGRTTKLWDAQCLPACDRKEVRVTIRDDRKKPRWWTEAPFSLELTYESMEMEYYTEVVTTTLPGFIAEIGGQYSLWLGISSTVFKWKFVRRKLFSNQEI